MKNTLKHITLLLVAFSITLISCKKETDDDPDGGEVDGTATCRLKTYGGMTYTYDADNQVTNFTAGSMEIARVTYIGDVIYSTTTIDPTGETVSTYEYDTAGKVTTAAVLSPGYTTPTIINYEYTDGKLTSKEHHISDAVGFTIMIKTIITHSGDNVSEVRVETITNGDVTASKTYTYEYDTKRNPYLEFGIQYTVLAMQEGFVTFASKNNITSITTHNNIDDTDEHETMTYNEYNSNGYPTKATSEDLGVITLTYYPCE